MVNGHELADLIDALIKARTRDLIEDTANDIRRAELKNAAQLAKIKLAQLLNKAFPPGDE